MDCRPLAGPSPPLAARSTLAIPTCPRGRRGPGNDAQPLCRSTDDPTARRERVRHRVHRAKRLATTSAQLGAKARSKRPLEPPTRRWSTDDQARPTHSGHTPRHRRPVFEGKAAACRRCSVMVERTSAHTRQNSGASGRRFVHQEGPHQRELGHQWSLLTRCVPMIARGSRRR